MIKQIGILRLLAISWCLTLHLHTINAMGAMEQESKKAKDVAEQPLPIVFDMWFGTQNKQAIHSSYTTTISRSRLSVTEVSSLLKEKMQNPKLNAGEFLDLCSRGLAQFTIYYKPTEVADNVERDEDPSSSSLLATTISGCISIAYNRKANCTCYTFPTIFLTKIPSDEAACVTTLREMLYDKIATPHLDATRLKRACAQGLLLFTLYCNQEKFKKLMEDS